MTRFRRYDDPVAERESVDAVSCVLCGGKAAKHKAEYATTDNPVLDVPTKRAIAQREGEGYVHVKCQARYKQAHNIPTTED